MVSPFANKRMMILGGIAVVALGTMSVVIMGQGGSEPPADDTAQKPKAVETRAPQPLPVAKTAVTLPTPPATKSVSEPKPADTADTAPGVPGDMGDEDIFNREKYTYRSLGRVDPFKSLVAGPVSDTHYYGDELDPEVLKLVGILEKNGERRALVEDGRGFGYVLRQGDRVLRGRVARIGADFITFRHSLYGVTETKTLTLDSQGQGGARHGRIR